MFHQGWGSAVMRIHAAGVLQVENFAYADDEYVTAGVADACLHPAQCYDITVDGPPTARWNIHDAVHASKLAAAISKRPFVSRFDNNL
eukprot:COSAG04_NODE_86_length_27446_cov_79.885046_10_plen_88_part_00